MAIIKTSYPEYYRQTSEIEDAINLWSEMLANDDPNIISKATKKFIQTDTKGFPPKIGQIRMIAEDIRHAEWIEHQQAANKLPEPERHTVPMPEELKKKIRDKFSLPSKEGK